MKTADEMFRRIGYKKAFEDADILEYAEDIEESAVRIIIQKSARNVTAYCGKRIVYLEYDEILAYAQLIKEMEANHEA